MNENGDYLYDIGENVFIKHGEWFFPSLKVKTSKHIHIKLD